MFSLCEENLGGGGELTEEYEGELPPPPKFGHSFLDPPKKSYFHSLSQNFIN